MYVKSNKRKILFFLLFLFIPFSPTVCFNLLKRPLPLWVPLMTYSGHLQFEHKSK